MPVELACARRGAHTLWRGLQKLLRSFPYHKIMCWGYSVDVFQFKFFTDEAGVAEARTDGKAKAQLISVVMTTRQVLQRMLLLLPAGVVVAVPRAAAWRGVFMMPPLYCHRRVT